jgi:hypothetical protein
MKIYLAGKISGRPLGEAQHHFGMQAAELRAKGHEVINPFELHDTYEKEWHEFMRVDIKALCDCDAIVMLMGWGCSRGARLEHYIAEQLEIKIFEEDKQMNVPGIYEN